jgi:UbiD family decarboxylase
VDARGRPPRNLREQLALLRREGELVTVEAEVDAHLEIAEIHRRVIAAGGPALLFKRVRGSPFPVVTNLFGTKRRVELAFGRAPEQFLRELVRLTETLVPPTLGKLWGARRFAARAARVGLAPRRWGPINEVRESPPGLDRLPALTSWPEDGGRFLTLPLVATRSPASGKPNLGMYRVQLHDAATTGIHWQIGKGGGFHHHEAEARGEALPIAVQLGGPPALVLAAVAPLPEDVPELLLASLCLGERLPVVRVNGLALAAEAEFALVGRVPPQVRRPEGPFGDHYGYYSLEHPYPVIEVEALHRRRDAIFPATVVGKPRQEDFFLGDHLQEMLSPLFPLVMPSVRSLWSYGETGYHALSAACVKDRYPREAMVSAFRILGEGQLSLTKFLLVTDAALDLRDFKGVLEHVLERARPETDLYVFSNLSMDTLDYTGPEVNKGSKGVLLGLGAPVRTLAREFKGDLPPGVTEAVAFCGGCLVVSGPAYSDDPDFAGRLARGIEGWPLVVLADDARATASSTTRFLWTTFTRFEPAADLHSASLEVVRHHLVHRGPIVIDARLKPWYPRELFADDATAGLVSRRWNDYFPGRRVVMGDAALAHLASV